MRYLVTVFEDYKKCRLLFYSDNWVELFVHGVLTCSYRAKEIVSYTTGGHNVADVDNTLAIAEHQE
jgi:hypothetical protein